MINGKKYSWEDITITFPQGTMVDVTEIEYSDKKEGEELYGKGSHPQGYGEGNYSAEGKAKMRREEYEKFTSALMKGASSIYNHSPFPVVVSYANTDQATVTDTLRSCKLQSISTGPKQGDKSVDMEIQFKILGGILWNEKEANI
jgi:hypothetical protein